MLDVTCRDVRGQLLIEGSSIGNEFEERTKGEKLISRRSAVVMNAPQNTYKNPTKAPLVEMDDRLNAGHWVEPANDIQL